MRLWFLPDPGDFNESDLQLLAVGIAEYVTPIAPVIVSTRGGGGSGKNHKRIPSDTSYSIFPLV